MHRAPRRPSRPAAPPTRPSLPYPTRVAQSRNGVSRNAARNAFLLPYRGKSSHDHASWIDISGLGKFELHYGSPPTDHNNLFTWVKEDTACIKQLLDPKSKMMISRNTWKCVWELCVGILLRGIKVCVCFQYLLADAMLTRGLATNGNVLWGKTG